MELEEVMQQAPYSLNKIEKKILFERKIKELSLFHYANCEQYKKLCDGLKTISPILPVRLFKMYELLSVPMGEVIKVMTSSGTTGQAVSKIFLDKYTASHQTKVLAKITSDFLGSKRLPMLIIDTKEVVKDRKLFSARGAGILGFSMLGYDVTYALDEKMKLNKEEIIHFLEKHKDKEILIFGFTFMIWKYFYQVLDQAHIMLDLSKGRLIHGGGWKKLNAMEVDEETFKSELKRVCGIQHVYNYYGMVEQTGSIYMGCEYGRLHASNFSDITIRNPFDFSECQTGELGLIQLDSLLPRSYPGHRLLTEDIGIMLGEDDCPCGRKGKTFKVVGRIKEAEVRGCSDTYAD